MVSTEIRWRLNEADTIFERFDKEIIAVQLASGTYHSFTGTGVDAFLLLLFEPTLEEMTLALAEKYEASPDVIQQDLEPFLKRLRERGIIVAQAANGNCEKRPALPHSGPRLAYGPPAIQLFHDLEELFVIDPVHQVEPPAWPPLISPPASIEELRYRLKSSTSMIFERFDEETVALNLASGACYSVTGPAEDIFLLLGEEPTKEEIVRILGLKYAAPDQEMAEAASAFLESLIKSGLAEQRVADRPAAAPAIRELSLAKPGVNVPLRTLNLEAFEDAPRGPITLLGDDPQGRSRLDYARKRFRIDESQILFRAADSGAVLINLEKGHYYLLNRSAATAWQLLRQEPTSTALVDALARLYDISRRELSAAVLILLHNLDREGLVKAERAQSGSNRLSIDPFTAEKQYEPFSVGAFRELRHLFLPFPGVASEKAEMATGGRELIALLAAYHEEVSKRDGLMEAVFKIAGQDLRIRCAGAIRASQLGLAFGHLHAGLASDFPPGFTIQVWDCVSGGPPSHPFLSAYLRDFHEHWENACGSRGEVRAFHSPEIPVLYHPGPDVLSVIDVERRTAYYLKRDGSPLPSGEFASPFKTILHSWLSTQGLQLVQGGAVGNANGGVLLVGKGAGKSTTALACLCAGMSYAGDEYCAVQLEGAPYLHSVYSSGALKGWKDLDRFPDLVEHVSNPDCFAKNNGDKAIFFLSQRWPGSMSCGFPLRAILVPYITGERDTRLGKCSEVHALLAISPATMAQLPMAAAKDLERLGDLVTRLPRYRLYLGTDLAQIPAVIQSVL